MPRILIICLMFATVNLYSNETEETQFNFKENIEKHYIKYNETLARIALQNNVSVAFLLYLNDDIYNPDKIFAGQEIKVPNKEAQAYIQKQSKAYSHLISKMGAMTYKERNAAIKEMIKKDWLVIPLLRQALGNKDVEIRENAREALREIHSKKDKISKIDKELN